MESALITTNQLKELTAISMNLDVELLESHLLIAQQLYVQPILGDALYTEILNQFDNNTLSGNNLTLYNEYLVPALSYSAWYCATPFLHYKTNRQGIGIQTTDVQTAATPEEMSLYTTRVENFMNFYNNRLNIYLEENQALFPLFRTNHAPQPLNKGGSFFLGFNSGNGCDNCDGW